MTGRGGFVAMVDAIFCMVAILIVIIVALPRRTAPPGLPPRADIVATCDTAAADGSLLLVVEAAGAEPDVRPAPRRLREQVPLMREMVEARLAEVPEPTARVLAVPPPGRDLFACLDILACAVGAPSPCRLATVPPWRENIARAIVDLGFETPQGGDDERG